MPEAFYLPRGDRLVPTDLTRGPWRPDAQHAGPLAALVGRGIERCEPRGDFRVARVTVEIMGPTPLRPLHVEAVLARPGRSVELVEATVRADAAGPDVVRARAWRVRTSPVGAAAPEIHPPPEPPEAGVERPFFPGTAEVGWHTGMEIRFLDGAFVEPGPARAWLRARQPLVAGEEPTPLQRLLLAADAANGISSPLDFRRFLFVNTELTVHLHRLPQGEWVHLDSRTIVDPDGVGMSDSVIADRAGAIGRGHQALLVAARDA